MNLELGAGLPCKHSARSQCRQLETDRKCQELIGPSAESRGNGGL